MDVSEAKRLRTLEDENRKLKKLLAESDARPRCAEGASVKKMVGPAAKREAVAHLRSRAGDAASVGPARSLPPIAR